MEAYMLALIDGEDDLKIRVLDLTPNIRNNIIVVPFSKFKEVLSSGHSMPGVKIINNKIYYYDEPAENYIPTVKSERSTSKSMTAIKAVYREDGKHEVILANCQGKLAKITLEEMAKTLMRYVKNVKLVKTYPSDKFPTVKSGQFTYKLVTPDGIILNTIGLPENTNNEYTVNSFGKTGDKLFDDWNSIEYFTSEMTSRMLSFELYNNELEIAYLDYRVPIINIPVGIKYINRLVSEAEDNNIKIVRIPNTVDCIKESAFKQLKDVNKLIYQPRDSGGKFDALGLTTYINRSMNRYIPDLIPTNIEELTNLFYGSDIASGDFSDLINATKLIKCVRGVAEVFDGFRLPHNIETLIDSFSHCTFVDIAGNPEAVQIKIPSTLSSISSSFSELNVAEVDFSEATSLSRIDWYSFSNLPIKKLDLSKCTSLVKINQSFKNLPELEEVILPPNLKSIEDSSFNNCPKLKHIELNDGLEFIGYNCFCDCGITEVEIPKSVSKCEGFRGVKRIFLAREEVNTGLLSGSYPSGGIYFEDGVKGIGNSAFNSYAINDVHLPNSISHIGYKAFSQARGKILDLFNFKVGSIAGGAFENGAIECIILPKSTTKLGEKVFYKSASTKKIYIPSGITEFENNQFTGCGSGVVGGTEFYVVAGSEGEKFLTKARKRVFICESDDDAYAAITGKKTESTEVAQAKAKLVLSLSNDPIARNLVSDENIGIIQSTFPIYTVTQSKLDVGSFNIPLDKAKLKDLFSVELFKNFIESNVKADYIKDMSDIWYYDQVGSVPLSNQFKLLANLITRFTKPLTSVYTQEGLYSLFNKMNNTPKCIESLNSKTLCLDDRGSICALYTKIPNETGFTNCTFYIIAIDGKVMYITADSCNHHKGYIKGLEYNCCPYRTNFDTWDEIGNTVRFDLSKILHSGDFIHFGSGRNTKIKGVNIPAPLASSIVNECYYHMIPIGIVKTTKDVKLVLLDMIDGTIYKGISVINMDSFISSVTDLSYINIEAIEKYGNWSDESLKIIKQSLFAEGDISDLINQWINNSSVLKELTKADGAYDSLEPANEWIVSRALQESGIKDLGRLNSKNIRLILESGFFSKTRKKLSELQEMQNYTTTTLADGSKLITVLPNRKSITNMIGFVCTFYTYLEIPGQAINETVDAYGSRSYPNSVFNYIYKIYSDKAKSYGYLKSDDIEDEISNFSRVWECDTKYSTISLGICINSADGVIYAYAKIGLNIYPIVRFKNMDDALKFGMMIFKDAERLNKRTITPPIFDLNHQIIDMVLHRIHHNRKPVSDFSEALTKVLDGYPNGYKLPGNSGILFELFAKQKVNP